MGFQIRIWHSWISIHYFRRGERALKQRLLIATSNRGKLREVQEILGTSQFELLTLADFPKVQPVAETGATFAENASLKASGYANQTDTLTLADDSGLEIDALGRAPGVKSARFLGEAVSYDERNRTILEQLQHEQNREARFVCVIAIAAHEGRLLHRSTGICEGRIARSARGTHGFGYDPIFIPGGYELTFGELPTELKNRISHRARAIESARQFLRSLTASSAAG